VPTFTYDNLVAKSVVLDATSVYLVVVDPSRISPK
jgi:hypothetical protein